MTSVTSTGPQPSSASSQTATAPQASLLLRLSVAQPWQTNAALLLLGILLVLLSRHLVLEYEDYTIGFSGTSGWSIWCYALAALLVLTQPVDRFTFPIILVVAIACRLATLFNDPFLSSDVYRYVWDGIVQHAGINPYRYVPADPALLALRDASDGDIFPHINRAGYARTIYPPVAQIFFWIITFISPTLTMMKTAMVLFEGLAVTALLALFRHLGIRREQILLYAWCPVLIWEIAGSGHLDAVIIALLSITLLFRYRRRPVLTGLFLGLAVATKLYPIVLLPALITRRSREVDGRPAAWYAIEWSMPVTCFAVIAIGYAAYSSVGKLVFGFLGGYVAEEGMSNGTRYFLLEQAQHLPGLHALSPTMYTAFAGLVLAIISLWAIRSAWQTTPSFNIGEDLQDLKSQLQPHAPAAFLPPAFAIAGALMLLFSPHYPWYIIWLLPFFTLLPNLPAFAYILGLFYLCTTALAVGSGPKQFLLNQILYSAVAIATIVSVFLKRTSAGAHLTSYLKSGSRKLY